MHHEEYKQYSIGRQEEGMIGTAWSGRHVVILHCESRANRVISLYKSEHAPLEPIAPGCAETLSRLLSIGYELVFTTPLSQNIVEYILVKK